MFIKPLFHDRMAAGRILAERLRPSLQDKNVIILALPRGGVVGFEIAQEFHADLDVFLAERSECRAMKSLQWAPLRVVACGY